MAGEGRGTIQGGSYFCVIIGTSNPPGRKPPRPLVPEERLPIAQRFSAGSARATTESRRDGCPQPKTYRESYSMQEGKEFVFETVGSMVFFLRIDVGDRGVLLRNADAERAVTRLPFQARLDRLVEPFGGAAF